MKKLIEQLYNDEDWEISNEGQFVRVFKHKTQKCLFNNLFIDIRTDVDLFTVGNKKIFILSDSKNGIIINGKSCNIKCLNTEIALEVLKLIKMKEKYLKIK